MHAQFEVESPEESSVSTMVLNGMRAGKPTAWEQTVKLYAPLVYQWCRSSGLSGEDARDVGQDVFRRVAEAIGDFRRDRPGDSFRGWLWRVTRNKIIDHCRRAARQPAAAGGAEAQQRLVNLAERQPEETEDPSGAVLTPLVHHAITLIRGGIEERTWQAFWRVTVDGRSTAEVAGELGMTVNAVRVARCKVLKRLREVLDGQNP